jgi:hypothetical protein
MYKVSDQQIEYILSDIRRNGVDTEDLQLNLLDHICCIIEQELDENGDFEQFYFALIKKFYKKELKEIEEETQSLLTYKNYYAMKKTMIISGVTSVSLLTMGIILKFLYQPGASFGIVLGIVLMSFLFLPLLFVLRIKENKENRDRVLIGFGTLAAMSLSLGILFKVMHWPGANMLSLASIIILLLLFLPIYFYNGIRNAESKTNTIVSSILIIAGCGLFLTLVRSPQGSKIFYIQTTKNYLRNEQLLANEKQLLVNGISGTTQDLPKLQNGKKIDQLCSDLKAYIIQLETGHPGIDNSFESQGTWLEDSQIGGLLEDDPMANKNLDQLQQTIADFNKENTGAKIAQLPTIDFRRHDLRSSEALNGIIQIQLSLLQNERALLAEK